MLALAQRAGHTDEGRLGTDLPRPRGQPKSRFIGDGCAEQHRRIAFGAARQQRHCLLRPLDTLCLNPELPDHRGEMPSLRLPLIDHQQRPPREQRSRSNVLQRGLHHLERNPESEGRATAIVPLHPDPPTHQLAELLADREAESRATEPTRGRTIGLREGFEHPLLLLLGEA